LGVGFRVAAVVVIGVVGGVLIAAGEVLVVDVIEAVWEGGGGDVEGIGIEGFGFDFGGGGRGFGVVEDLFGERGSIGDGFDFEIGVCGQEGVAGGDLLAEEFGGAFDAEGEAIEFLDDGVEEGGGGGEDFGDVGFHGVEVEAFHLEEAELVVDELVEEGDLGGGDGFELGEEVLDDFEGDLVIVDEGIEIGEGEDAVFEGIGGGDDFALRGAGAGGFEGVGAVGGEGGGGHGFGAFFGGGLGRGGVRGGEGVEWFHGGIGAWEGEGGEGGRAWEARVYWLKKFESCVNGVLEGHPFAFTAPIWAAVYTGFSAACCKDVDGGGESS